MSNVTPKQIMRALVVSTTVLWVGCSGDGRPLQEAVEINDLNLESIVISQPESLLSNLVVNTGTTIQFSLTGVTQTGSEVALSSGNRRWTVTPAGAASIDDSGKLTTIDNSQTLEVKVRIGAFGSTFIVNVEDAVLESVESIMGLDSLERCIPRSYKASGIFSDGSMRGLPNASWNVATQDLGSTGDKLEGAVPVTALNVGTLALVVSQDGISAQKSIVVENTLQEIRITPTNLAVQEENTLSLGATGMYVKEGVQRDVAITNSVNWSVPANNDVVLVGNTQTNKGAVSTVNVGNTQVTASCGDVVTQRPITVIERGSTSATDITFNGDSPREISLSTGAVQLRASTGTTYNVDNDISTSADTSWAVISGTEFVRFSTTDGKNTIVPLAIGVATVQVSYKDTTEDLEIQVTP